MSKRSRIVRRRMRAHENWLRVVAEMPESIYLINRNEFEIVSVSPQGMAFRVKASAAQRRFIESDAPPFNTGNL